MSKKAKELSSKLELVRSRSFRCLKYELVKTVSANLGFRFTPDRSSCSNLGIFEPRIFSSVCYLRLVPVNLRDRAEDSFEFMMYQFYSTSSSVSTEMETTISRTKLMEQARLDFRIAIL